MSSQDKTYRVKELFYTLQGEGAHVGRPAVFCRFSKCNLWNGREDSRATAICNFCDTDILGTDGQNGGVYTALELTQLIVDLWPGKQGQPYVVCTGGEPLLQLDNALIESLQKNDFEVGVETNGTLPAPSILDWVCVSPKADAEVVILLCDELKLVYPQALAPPENFDHIEADHYYLSPMADPLATDNNDVKKSTNTEKTLNYCLKHPKWKLNLQTHKLLGID
jgi:7-carboxy-7-deazaguanine synthase (Cx14CxxC type)